MKAFKEANVSNTNAKNVENQGVVEKIETQTRESKKPAIGYSSYKEQPGYAADYRDGYNKYDSMLQFQKEAEQEMSDPDVINAHELVKQVVKEKAEESLLGKARNIASSNAFRAAFLSLMLFSKVGQASAENFKSGELPAVKKIEQTVNNTGQEKVSEGNYVAGYAEFLKIKASNSFETDKADINPEAAAEIQANFKEFLSGINNENFEDVMSKDWVIRGSSDERITSNWGGSNENLTVARTNALYQIIKESVMAHKYKPTQRLTQEQTMKILGKKIDVSYPQGREGKENGVTYITDKINPKTGENYTDTEVAKIKKDSPEEYQKLLESCRFTNFETESSFFADVENFDQVHFLIDESGSMAKSKHFISNHLRSIEVDKKINLNLYSDQINDESIMCVSSSEAADKILSLKTEGSFRERQVNSTLGLINRLAEQNAESQKNGKGKASHKVYVATDEAIQHTNSAVLELLQNKAEQAGVDIEFLIGYSKWVGSSTEGYSKTEVMKLPLDELADKVNFIKEDAFKKGVNKNIKSQKVDAFYESDYQSKKAEFTAYLANSESKPFLDLLKSRGYGSSAEEVADSLDKQLSGPKNYLEIYSIINPKSIEQQVRLSAMGQGGSESKIGPAVKNSINALRRMIEAKNERDLVLETVKDMPSDKIPDIKDHVMINVIDDVAPVQLPVNGLNNWTADLYY